MPHRVVRIPSKIRHCVLNSRKSDSRKTVLEPSMGFGLEEKPVGRGTDPWKSCIKVLVRGGIGLDAQTGGITSIVHTRPV